jgi:hypothetical protein
VTISLSKLASLGPHQAKTVAARIEMISKASTGAFAFERTKPSSLTAARLLHILRIQRQALFPILLKRLFEHMNPLRVTRGILSREKQRFLPVSIKIVVKSGKSKKAQ